MIALGLLLVLVGFALIVPRGGIPGSASVRNVRLELAAILRHAWIWGASVMEVPADPDHHGIGRDGWGVRADRHVELTSRPSAVEVEDPIGYVSDGRIVTRHHDAGPASTIARKVRERWRYARHLGGWLARRPAGRSARDHGAAQRHALLLTERRVRRRSIGLVGQVELSQDVTSPRIAASRGSPDSLNGNATFSVAVNSATVAIT